MDFSLLRLDVTQIFCDVDDFYRLFDQVASHPPQLPWDGLAHPTAIEVECRRGDDYRHCLSRFRVSDLQGCLHLPSVASLAVLLSQLSELHPVCRDHSLECECVGLFLTDHFWLPNRLSFIDSTSVEVCHPNRARSHKVFKYQAGWGKSSVKWYFGLKLHLIINDCGELLAAVLAIF